MMETRFYLKKSNTNPKVGRVYFKFQFNGKPLRISTGLGCNVKDFQDGYPKQIAATKALRNRLGNYKTEVDDYIETSIKGRGKKPTVAELKSFISKLLMGEQLEADKTTVKTFIDEYIEECKVKLGEGTVRYKRGHLDDFHQFKPSITIQDLSKDLLYNYRIYRLKQSNEVSTFNSYMKSLKSFLNWLDKREITQTNYAKYIEKEKAVEKNVIALYEEEVDKLYDTVLNNTLPIHLQNQIDIFVFSCFTCLDISTMKGFDINDIDGDVLNHRRVKTGKVLEIPLLPEAKYILEKHNYELPFISDVKGNVNLKKAFRRLGLDRMVRMTENKTGQKPVDTMVPLCNVISWHNGRKTAITTALTKGMPASIVMELSGITKEQTLKSYKGFAKQTLILEMQKMSKPSRLAAHLKKVE